MTSDTPIDVKTSLIIIDFLRALSAHEVSSKEGFRLIAKIQSKEIDVCIFCANSIFQKKRIVK